MNINDNFEFLNVGLPEDILRRKTWGDFEGAVRLIDKRLAGEIPDALRACLICEREMILRLEKDYPFSEADALAKIRAAIPDFSEDEFHAMVDDNKIDWIYVHGEPHYFLRFYHSFKLILVFYCSLLVYKSSCRNKFYFIKFFTQYAKLAACHMPVFINKF